MRTVRKLVSVLFVLMLGIMCVFSGLSVQAADDFEKQISAFPESYKPYLRELHEEYPTWTFQPFVTGLDWNTVIDNEHDDYALVYNPDAARIFKSLDPDDYIESEDRFIYKDGSFVAASRAAVEYFMDPRNFLDKGGIFQFEVLSFSSLYTVDMVEAVLDGSFMGESKMTYVDAKGKKYTDNKTYAQAIYEAGKKYNINPCFLASKILNEVGSKGSDSVSGTNKTYPGIYNFYNIGATDGAGAVERGLLWAKGGSGNSTYYGRPWTTPYKSIMGGAQFLAEEYIAAGQFTGYLQRFNVNPDSDYNLYSHQYMSNLTGALSQGYSTYRSYRDMKMLNTNLTFSIPVYKNMSDTNGNGKLEGAESTEQYGSVTASFRYVRKGPSVDHDIATSSSGDELYLERGDEVKILGKVDTDAYYYEEILSDPYWYKVSFTFGGKTCTGYIPGDEIDIKTIVYAAKGRADIALVKSASVKNKIIASNPSMVKIIDGDTVEFLKNGTVKLYFYDSYGHIEEILFKVGNYASYYASGVKTSASGTTVTVSSASHPTAASYGYALSDTSGNMRKAEFKAATSRVFDGLKAGTPYIVYAQNCFGKNAYTKAVAQTVITKPDTVKNLTFVKNASGGASLSWTPVSKATAYEVYSYNRAAKKYTKVTEIVFGQNKVVLSAAQAAADEFVVRAYTKYGSAVSYGGISNMICLSEKPYTPTALKASAVSATGYTLSWTGHKECDGYEIHYAALSSDNFKLYRQLSDTSITFKGIKSANGIRFKIRSFKNKSYGKLYSDFSDELVAATLPETVSGLKATAGSSKITLSWTPVSGASYYNLLYKKAGDTLKTVKVTGASYTLTNASAYSNYYFAVSAAAVINGKTLTGALCTAIGVKTKPPVPKGLAVSSRGYNYIDLKWNKDANLNAFRVYYLDSTGKLIGNKVVMSGNSVRISGLSPLTAYRFIIRGYKLVNGSYIASDNSTAVTASTVIPKVTGVKASAVKAKSLRLTWNSLQGAVNYNLYYYTNGDFKKVLAPKTNYCDVTFLPESTKGKFYVTAVFKNGSKVIESEPSSAFTASVLPGAVTSITLKTHSNRAELKWNLVKNADCYGVYIKQSGKYVLKSVTTTNSCTLTGLKDCTGYNVAVRAYFKNTTGNVGGVYLSKSFTTPPVEITQFSRSNVTETSYTLTWNKSSSSVNRYYLYRYSFDEGKFELLTVTDGTSFEVTGLEAGTQQRYAVIAAVVKNGKVTAKSNHTFNFDCVTPDAEPAVIVENESVTAENTAEFSVGSTVASDYTSLKDDASTNSAENSQ